MRLPNCGPQKTKYMFGVEGKGATPVKKVGIVIVNLTGQKQPPRKKSSNC